MFNSRELHSRGVNATEVGSSFQLFTVSGLVSSVNKGNNSTNYLLFEKLTGSCMPVRDTNLFLRPMKLEEMVLSGLKITLKLRHQKSQILTLLRNLQFIFDLSLRNHYKIDVKKLLKITELVFD